MDEVVGDKDEGNEGIDGSGYFADDEGDGLSCL